ncbi:protein of unknown function [Caldanaerovirga acetigignens]|uniref:DUF4277 domain-containing protein n=2 Tax=Caldanaerovirga acetigignens TaxID=447595 RepID=A0A1M7LEQ7_9FIRM|nr:protein of unknown function [Caldanaerovirga acetigignens]
MKELGAGPVISAIFRQIGCHNTINQMLTWNEKQCLHSPATHILAIIINILSGKRVALYKVFSTLALKAVIHENIDTKVLHGDTDCKTSLWIIR